MKKLALLLFIAIAVAMGWEHYKNPVTIEPLVATPYVFIYGRNSCGLTKRTLREVRQYGLNYKYAIIDEKQVADIIHTRMRESGISTTRYNLPVVDVNGSILIRPKIEDILDKY